MKTETNNYGIGAGELIQLSGLKKKYISSLCGIRPSRLSEFFTATRPLNEFDRESLRETLLGLDQFTRGQVENALLKTESYFEEKI